MKLTEDFYNRLARAIRGKYFPNEDHGTTENANYHKTSSVMESFNNGLCNYSILITLLSKYCKDSKKNIHTIVSQFVEDFGEYSYPIAGHIYIPPNNYVAEGHVTTNEFVELLRKHKNEPDIIQFLADMVEE